MNSTSIDRPIARKTLERITQPFQIYFLLFMSMLGSGLFIAGMIGGGLNWLDHTTLPDSTMTMMLGVGSFAFFFPWFLCLYCCRIILRSVRDLEQKVESLKHDS